MIIYDKRKPKTFDGANCVGITGENLAETQEFLIRECATLRLTTSFICVLPTAV